MSQYNFPAPFSQRYDALLKRLTLRGLRPKTVELYSHGVRRAAKYFDCQIDALTKPQLTEYFTWILKELSWSTLKHDLYGLQFYYKYVLEQPWPGADLVKPPKVSRLPDIVSVSQLQKILAATRVLSYRVMFFTLYSMGLRLGEGLRLRPADIDAERMQVHVRNAKGNRDRVVPLPDKTLQLLREFWRVHRNPEFIFPSRHNGLKSAPTATTHMEDAGVQRALAQVRADLGLKKTLRHILCVTVMRPI